MDEIPLKQLSISSLPSCKPKCEHCSVTTDAPLLSFLYKPLLTVSCSCTPPQPRPAPCECVCALSTDPLTLRHSSHYIATQHRPPTQVHQDKNSANKSNLSIPKIVAREDDSKLMHTAEANSRRLLIVKTNANRSKTNQHRPDEAILVCLPIGGCRGSE
jgi:hypothetical protein